MMASQTLYTTILTLGILVSINAELNLQPCPGGEDYRQLGECLCLPDDRGDVIGVGCINTTLTSLPNHIPKHATIFYFDDNNLGGIESIPASYHYVEYMYMRNNKISSIKKLAFKGVEEDHGVHLLELDLSNNTIQRLFQETLTGLTRLENLTLYGNQIYELQNAFADLKSLRAIDLRNNQLRRLDDNIFANLPNLTDVALEMNNFQGGIPYKALSVLKQMQILNLRSCNIAQLHDDGFLYLQSLEQLYLQHNDIEYITNNSFNGLMQLSVLDLSYNKIHTIDTGAFQYFYDTILEVNLQGNQIMGLHPSMLPWERINVLMQGNPLECDCDLVWAQLSASRSGEQLICTGPEHLINRTVNSLQPNEFVCDGENMGTTTTAGLTGITLILVIVIPIALVVIIVIVTAVCCVVKKRKAKSQRRSVKYSAVYKPTTEQNAQSKTVEKKTMPKTEL